MKHVVITAFETITPLGSSINDIISCFKNGRVFFERFAGEPGPVVAPVRDFDIRKVVGRHKNIRYLNRGGEFSLATAFRALKSSCLDGADLQGCGLVVGCGPHLDLGEDSIPIQDHGIAWDNMPALWLLRFLPNTAASVIAGLLHIHGENKTINTACASGLQAVGEGFRLVKSGLATCVLCGAGDSRLSAGGLKGYSMAQALADGESPEQAIRPFDADRNGFVPGEGAAFFMLEEHEHARARNAGIICEVAGFATSIDGSGMTAPHPDGIWAEKAVLSALKEAALSPADIDLVSAHATGTILNDKMEAQLIKRLFEAERPPVVALKSWIGHLASACGAAELALVLGCMKNGYFPEIRNLARPCSDSVNFVQSGLDLSPENVLLQNFGFGGQNAALVIKKAGGI